jgi:hypothetical protein
MLTGQNIQLEEENQERAVETLRIREEIMVHIQQNVKRRIQRKKFLELEKKEIETSKPTKKVWQRKVSSPTTTPSGDDNRTQGMDSPAPDSKPELSPSGNMVVIHSLHLHIG